MVLIKEYDSIKDTVRTHVYVYIYYRKNRRHFCSTSFILTETPNQPKRKGKKERRMNTK